MQKSLPETSERLFMLLCRMLVLLSVLYLVNYSLECCGVVHSKICNNFAVDFDTSLVDKTHKL